MNELVKTCLTYLTIFFGGSLITVIVIFYVLGESWSKAKIILSDIFRFFGWISIKCRRFSIEQEYSGTINSIIYDYNKNFENPIMPHCKIEWVTPNNQRNILKENEAIVCLSFDKKDHNLNFYNATLNFVQTALIAKAKICLKKQYSQAIDLLTTYTVLKNNRREVLTTFNKKLDEFDKDTKDEFTSLVPTNDRGLFFNMLLPEFHLYGELIGTLPLSDEFKIEANRLFEWFKDLATRELDDKTNLKYISKNIKIGVILVGKDETWENQGVSAYTKWANYYAMGNYNSVYILARGKTGEYRAHELVKILVNSKGFIVINKNHSIKCALPDGKEYIVTCFSLRPDKATILYLAWEELKTHYKNNTPVSAIVEAVRKDMVVVNVCGLRYELPNTELSSDLDIPDASKIFKTDDELFLNIVDFNADIQHVVFSNKGTQSDPKHFIDTVLNDSQVYNCKIEHIQTNKQGEETGLMVSHSNFEKPIYIPKSKATYSRFLNLKMKFAIDSELPIKIIQYNTNTGNFIGQINNIIDPWLGDTFKKIKKNDVISVYVKQINEFFITCEIEEGLECRLIKNEISWNPNDCKTSQFNIDAKIDVKVLFINADRKQISVSIKKLSNSTELEYFEHNKNSVMQVKLVEIIKDKGLKVQYDHSSGVGNGFINWSELGYGFIGKIENIFKQGDKLDVLLFDFDSEKNSLKFSLKKIYQHQFAEWLPIANTNNLVKGKIIRHFENSTQVELSQNNFIVQAIILRKDISNLAFVEQSDLPYYLPINEEFDFNILEIDRNRQLISLTRKNYLKQCKYPNYGDTISVKYVKKKHSKAYFYSNTIEGIVNLYDKPIKLGTTIDIMLASASKSEFVIVE